MSLNQVSKVYATALLELARDASTIDETEAELTTVVEAFSSDESIRHYFLSPLVDPILKEKAAYKALQGKASDIVANFVALLVRKDRFLYLSDVLDAFRSGVDALKNRSSLKIYSKELLSAEQKERISKYVANKFQREMRIEEFIDPTVIGGFRLYVDDFLIDASIHYKLQVIKQALLHTKIPAGAIYEN
jgi:F-type H+-transporting ATPase subunit delta